jgi:hypothetical protein
VSNYLYRLVRKGAGLSPASGQAPAIVPPRVPSWMPRGPAVPSEPPALPAASGNMDAPAASGSQKWSRLEPLPRPPEEPSSRRAPPPAVERTPAPQQPQEPQARGWTRSPASQPTFVTPEPTPLHLDRERPEPPPGAGAIPERPSARKVEPSVPAPRPLPSETALENTTTPATVGFRPAAHQPEPERRTILPAPVVPPRPGSIASVSKSASESIEPLLAKVPPPALQPVRPARVLDRDIPTALATDREPPAVLMPRPLESPAARDRAPAIGLEAIRGQRVTVHIGAIEIRTAETRRPAAAPSSAPSPPLPPSLPVPVPAGFDAYARLRTYAPWYPGGHA